MNIYRARSLNIFTEKKLRYQAADVAALDTRKKKPQNLKLGELKKVWKEELVSVGFSSKEFIAELDKNRSERNEKNSTEKNSLEAGNVNITKNAKEAVKDAIEHLSQYSLKLDYAKIIEKSLEFAIGKNTHKDMVIALSEAVKEGRLIPLDKPDATYVTKELIETEKAIMDMVGRSKAAKGIKESTAITLKDNVLNSIAAGKMKDCAVEVLQSNKRLGLVESQMRDNTEFISAVFNLAESSGKTVRILLPNRIMANDINESIKRKPSNLWQWLVSLGKPELGESILEFMHKYKEEVNLPLLRFRQNKEVIVVNNAETLGCRDKHSLLELTEKTNAKVIFLRDLNSKHGFNAGNSIETLKQASIETFKINAAEKILSYVPELNAIQDNNERTKQLARAYALKEDKERDNTLVFVGSKEQLKSTNEAIREELKNQGKLSGIEHGISVLTPVYLSKPETTLAHQHSKNMVIRFYYPNYPPQDWNIESVNRDTNTLRLARDGKWMLWGSKLGSKNWNPKNQETNHAVFKKEILQIARGDKLIATGNMRALGIKNATKLIVQEIDNKHVKLLSSTKEAKEIKISLDDLKDSHFQYDYATTLSKYSKKESGHIIADIKAYSLDKDVINELTSRAKESLIIFTNDEKIAQKRFGSIPIKLTAAEALLDAVKLDAGKIAGVDRFINDKTISEIKSDIEKAIVVLDDQYKLVEKPDKKAVDFAIEKITSRNAGFTHKGLVTEALEYALNEQIAVQNKEITGEDIEKVIAEKRAAGELIMGRHFDDGTRWTTKEILELERAIISDMKKCQVLEPLLDKKTATNLLEAKNDKITLTQDQKDACYLITTTKDQFVIIQGYAGTGKTAMFSKVQNMLKKKQGEVGEITENGGIKGAEENKKNTEILGLAPTHQTVIELRNKGIEAQTLKSFLVELQRENSAGEHTNEAKSKLDIASLDNKLIILDEVSMVSNEDFRQFQQFQKIVGGTKSHVVLSGDIAQHISISSGKPFEMIQRSNILKTAYLREIVRQKNPNLKEAVESTIHKNYATAFEKIANENPQKHIKRIDANLGKKPGADSAESQKQQVLQEEPQISQKQNDLSIDFFNTLERSIVEIDNNKLKEGEKTLEQMVAEDYLSRTPETRDQTVIIVHANDDRRVITEFIRDGLKDQGVIAQKSVMADCLIAKGLTDAEHKSLRSYNLGDVVKFGKTYYHVVENDKESKSLLLRDVSGKERHFYPEKYVDKYKPEVYEHIKAELAVGDVVRLTKTDKKRDLYAGFEYKVKEVRSDAVILESKDKSNSTKDEQQTPQNSQSTQITLNPKELKDAHWDYAQTVTGYGIQGGSKTYAIDFEVSYREELANQRSFYIGISRAIMHLIIYTNDKAKLLRRILGNKGDKYAALEVTGDLPASNNNIEPDRTNKKTEVTKAIKVAEQKEQEKQIENESQKNFYDIKKIKQFLSNSAESFVERLLGKPNERLSSATEWRYGNKGSLVISMGGDNRGRWHNFETGEFGDLLALIQKKTESSFHETLKSIVDMFGKELYVDIVKPDSAKVSTSDDKAHNKGKDKTSEYAQKLAAESMPIVGTIVEKYLKGTRSITNLDSPDIRYHPKVFTGKNEKQKYMPAMLAIGRDKEGKIQCVQATYLDSETANKADLDVKKRTYASPSGASVSLQKHEISAEKNIDGVSEDANKNNKKNEISFIAEGAETGLSIKDAVGAIKNSNVVVTLGKSNFVSIDPQSVGQKIIFCLDNDGEKSFTDNTIHKAAQRLIDFGKEVFIAVPDQITSGKNGKTDFNDVAKVAGIAAVKSTINNSVPYKEWKDDVEKNKLRIDNEITPNIAQKVLQRDYHIDNKLYNSLLNNAEINFSAATKLIDSEQTKYSNIYKQMQNDLSIQKNISNTKIPNTHDTQKFLSKTEKEIY